VETRIEPNNDGHGITAEAVSAYVCQIICCHCQQAYDEELDRCPVCGRLGCG